MYERTFRSRTFQRALNKTISNIILFIKFNTNYLLYILIIIIIKIYIIQIKNK